MPYSMHDRKNETMYFNSSVYTVNLSKHLIVFFQHCNLLLTLPASAISDEFHPCVSLFNTITSFCSDFIRWTCVEQIINQLRVDYLFMTSSTVKPNEAMKNAVLEIRMNYCARLQSLEYSLFIYFIKKLWCTKHKQL